jgi:hypothetical protein
MLPNVAVAADPCDGLEYASQQTFSRVLACIKDLQAQIQDKQVQIDSLEAAHSILESDICALAHAGLDHDPNAIGASLAVESCPAPRLPNKKPPVKK